MEAGPLPGGANVWSLEPGDWRRRCEDLLVLRIALSRHSDCYRIVIFLLPIGDDSRSRQFPRTIQGCRRRLKHWRHDRKSIGPRRPAALPTRKAQGLGGGRHCFRLSFTMRVVADRTCNYSPKLSANDDRRSGAIAEA